MDAGEILLQRGLLDQRQLDQARQTDGASVLDAAIELGFVSEEVALRAVGEVVGLEYVDLAAMDDEQD